jgi:nucleoside-triphosphatase
VDLEVLERLAVGAIHRALVQDGLVVIDEIGPMELLSHQFRAAVLGALDSPNPLLGTIMGRKEPFSDEIKRRSEVTLLEVTPEVRDSLPEHILTSLRRE